MFAYHSLIKVSRNTMERDDIVGLMINVNMKPTNCFMEYNVSIKEACPQGPVPRKTP
jgi:hypothetical protein